MLQPRGGAAVAFLLLQLCRSALGHGRLMDPPARNSMWRFGFPNPVNYNDNELFCGGYAVGPEPGPVRRVRRPLALRDAAPRGGRPVRQGHHRQEVQRGTGDRHRDRADREPLGPLRAQPVPQQQPGLRGDPGLLRQVPSVHFRHPRPRLPHPDQHQEEGRAALPGAPAALRDVHAVRHAVDLLHRQHVGHVSERHRGRGLRTAGDVPELRRRVHHHVHRRAAARVRQLRQPLPAVRPRPARPQLPVPPRHQIPGVCGDRALPASPRHRPLVRDQLPAVPAQLPARGLPVPDFLRGDRGTGGQRRSRRLLPRQMHSLPIDKRMPRKSLPMLLISLSSFPFVFLSMLSYQRVFWLATSWAGFADPTTPFLIPTVTVEKKKKHSVNLVKYFVIGDT